MSWQIISLVALVGLLNAIVTTKIIRSEFFQARQKFLQMMFVWLVPITGAVVCLVVIASDLSNRRDRSPNTTDLDWEVVPTRAAPTDGN